jgi:hypothetical protein
VTSTAETAYAERLTVPLRWWVQGTMLVATLWLALVVAVPGPVAWVITAVALSLLAAALLSYGSARITLRDGELHAGPAHIDVAFLGPAVALDPDQARRAAGVDADARAFLVLRPYLKRAVKVTVTDPADPTPYWLVSTRHPERLVEALQRATRL